MNRARWGHTFLVRLALIAAIVAAMHHSDTTIAGLPERYGELASHLPGIEHAIGRSYSDDYGSPLTAFVFRFRDATSASHALDALDPGFDRPSWDEHRITIDGLGPQTRAYHRVIEGYPSTEILTHHDVSVYVVSLEPVVPDLDTVSLATDVITSMVGTAAGEGLGAYKQDGSSMGGLWDASDVQFYPKLPGASEGGSEPPGASEGDGNPSEGSVDGSDRPEASSEGDPTRMEGFQRGVGRIYGGDPALLDVPGPLPEGFYMLMAGVSEFDTPDHAQAAAVASYESGVRFIIGDSDVNVTPVDLGALGVYAQAAVVFDALDGVTMEVSVVVVQDGPYVYATFTVARGPEADTVARSAAVIEAMLAADAGTGNETFDPAGGSTGGLWDKLPSAGDPVLQGLEPTMDQGVSPGAPSEGD
jgi:hypothetical protein